jgi:hydroxypyruvate isomerase
VPGRLWPGTGEMNYGNLFKHIVKKMQESGRDFIFGMEHGPWKPNKADERACIESYVSIEASLSSMPQVGPKRTITISDR